MSSEVTSETKLGISQPYPFQCHEIDQSIAVAKKVKAYAVSGQLKTELEDTIDVLGDIEWETLDIIDSYEELRGALTAVHCINASVAFNTC